MGVKHAFKRYVKGLDWTPLQQQHHIIIYAVSLSFPWSHDSIMVHPSLMTMKTFSRLLR